MVKDQYYSHDREEMAQYIPKGINTLLEIGCAKGKFGALLKSKMPELETWGIELNADIAEIAKSNLDYVLAGNFETDSFEQLEDNFFDCIVLNDVLEHFVDTWKALAKIRALLKQDGQLVVCVPNVRFWGHLRHLLVDKDWEYQNWGTLDRTHMRFFTEKSLTGTLIVCGFDIVTVHGIHENEFTWKFRLLNAIFMKRIEDMKYFQIVGVARVSKS